MDLDEWVTSSNECFDISLYRPGPTGDERIREPFNPSFTHSVIDENESIVGYKNPKIELDFRTNDLKPKLKISFDAQLDLTKLSPDLDQAQVDLSPDLFKNYLPEESKESKEEREHATRRDWKPPGQLMQSFAVHGRQYEIWKSPMLDPAARQIWKNLRILVLLFIDGATIEGLDDEETLDRWSLYFLYEVDSQSIPTSPYILAGFATSYRTWIFPTFKIARYTKMLPSPPPEGLHGAVDKYTPPRLTQDSKTFQFNQKLDRLETSSRERISQFLILPPHQNQSLGSRLYNFIFDDLVKKPFIYEIPVEDPSEDFDAMRDYCDIVYLRALPAFKSLSVVSSLPAESLRKDSPIPRDQILGNGVDLEELRHSAKIVTRQFYRMVELHALSTIPPNHRNRARITRKAKSSNENDRKYYFWRLALKHRIYMQNADALDQMEVTEKVDKLEAAVDNQQEEFEERLEGIEKRARWDKGEESSSGARSKRKRVVVEDEDDDDCKDTDTASAASKKPKA
ncbi:Histone acetyltransferase [Ascochyta rabiei]|uniref:Histone acetyltransferase type B catalytic subunit n=1 Tax=Didymella rabiei TaxID=5454 RepID=A0A163E7R5_DIDRA|nr:Histone acetyltransferase [Ascochyta rabiei]KZM23562.1 histone acetyltransferase [Ascochyta rabiei]UPX21061.1 Histone acetyltransferase [Ascochyta rabiei]